MMRLPDWRKFVMSIVLVSSASYLYFPKVHVSRLSETVLGKRALEICSVIKQAYNLHPKEAFVILCIIFQPQALSHSLTS